MLGLKMKISDVEYQGDGKKATFYYTADERVDFRELIKRLAEEFRIRVEMRQIGIRQEASRVGGIGSCGRELCCSTWLTDFKAVSTSSARYQNLSINPAKLAGQCGKLKCCLNYELDAYMEALKEIPNSDIKLHTDKGTAVHLKTDIFRRMMWYAYLDPEKKGSQFFPSDAWIAVKADRVREIIALNKQNEKPADLVEDDFQEPVREPDYADVVGQDSLTRMDKRRKKKRKNKRRNKDPQQKAQGRPGQEGGRKRPPRKGKPGRSGKPGKPDA
jgi:cell fate regulator YaaT (PSP1 superfamily)